MRHSRGRSRPSAAAHQWARCGSTCGSWARRATSSDRCARGGARGSHHARLRRVAGAVARHRHPLRPQARAATSSVGFDENLAFLWYYRPWLHIHAAIDWRIAVTHLELPRRLLQLALQSPSFAQRELLARLAREAAEAQRYAA